MARVKEVPEFCRPAPEITSMFQRVYGMSYMVQNHQKHAQSTYLDEYLWFKKNLAEKFLLEKVLEHLKKLRQDGPSWRKSGSAKIN